MLAATEHLNVRPLAESDQGLLIVIRRAGDILSMCYSPTQVLRGLTKINGKTGGIADA